MSYDEQPDPGVHDECAYEIAGLNAELDTLRRGLALANECIAARDERIAKLDCVRLVAGAVVSDKYSVEWRQTLRAALADYER